MRQVMLFLPVFLSLARASAGAEGLVPDEQGWIRHWVVYGPIACGPEDMESPEILFHPFTFAPLVSSDFIEEGTNGDWTQWNFLPAPGRSIETEFGLVLPEHDLRKGAGPGINPEAPRLTGIAWMTCGCSINFDEVFNFKSPENGYAGGTDIRGYVAYAYAYVELTGDQPLDVFLSFHSDDSFEVLLGKVGKPGEGFLAPVYLANVYRAMPSDCTGANAEANGPTATPGEREELLVTLEPGLNLLLVKVLEGHGEHAFRFRFRHNDPPEYTPLSGNDIRIHLTPDLGEPAPPLFRRMDVNGDSSIDLADAIGYIFFLFSGDGNLPCPDAADGNDDGVLDLSDALHTLQHLFLDGTPPPFPRGCCGLDPTRDGLPGCRPDWPNCDEVQ